MFDQILELTRNAAQQAFDTIAKPEIIKQMKRVKCLRIQHVMGVDFYQFSSGATLSDSEMEDASEAKAKLCNIINELQAAPLYNLIDWDIDLTKTSV